MAHQDKFDSMTLQGLDAPVKGEHYCLPWPAWGTAAQGHPGTPLLYDTTKSVAEGELPFRARWGVEHEGANMLAEDAYTVGSEIEDGYPEITLGMIHALGWSGELTARERLIIIAVGADRFRWELFDIAEEEARAAIDAIELSNLRNRCDGNSEDIEGSWMTGGNGGVNEGDKAPLTQLFPDCPHEALTAIEAYLSSNPQEQAGENLSLRSKIERVN